ncbi:cytochrome P450 [Rhodofomes roseus]|uniref:Cytochrome P450 n=1 Tax=Rhodofomes roseus TaxID=34475 RepID=A0ABQ8KSW4_9APHY|nr:cytochrome P450 [Rhodofomes roseus]KAH9840926.1 cytochrome P450 [Rhodofomes roseus]
MAYVSFSASQGLALCAVSWLLWRILKARLASSSLDNIRGPPSESFVAGNYGQLYHRQGWDFHRRLWAEYGSVVKVHAAFGTECLYVYDPATLNCLLSDATAVEQSGFIAATYRLLLGPGLMSARGDHHRRQRKTLNPVFSPRNLKEMLPVIYGVIHKLRDAMSAQLPTGTKELDMLQWTNRGALEVMGQAGLGYSFTALGENPSNDFARALKGLFPAMQRVGFLRTLTPFFIKLGPRTFRRRLAELVALPWKSARDLLAVVDTLDRKSREILDTSRRLLKQGDGALANREGRGRDLMTCLLKANEQAEDEDKLTDEEILGQVASFVLAGADSSAIALALIIQHLAERPDIQEKLRSEIVAAREGRDGDLSYEELVKLPYVDAVVKETLRLNPPPSQVSRQLCKDVVAPISSPITGKDGRLRKEVVIPKGTIVFIGILASNINPAVWGEDAAEWKPERWLAPPPSTLVDAHIPGVYSSLMTFVGGNRSCIGLKFAELELKAMLSVLLESFDFSTSGKDIVWNLATVRFPTVGVNGTKPELPLMVKPLKGKV